MARGWPTSFRLPLRALGEIEILVAGEVVFGLVGVDGQRIEIFDALRRLRLCVPFMKGAVQVLRDSAAQVRATSTLSLSLSNWLSRCVASCWPPPR
jgi:hypothetical protein